MPMTPDQISERYKQPFIPAGGNIDAQFRVANALEYIAAAMGRISERLESIDQKLARRNSPTTGEPPFYPRHDPRED